MQIFYNAGFSIGITTSCSSLAMKFDERNGPPHSTLLKRAVKVWKDSRGLDFVSGDRTRRIDAVICMRFLFGKDPGIKSAILKVCATERSSQTKAPLPHLRPSFLPSTYLPLNSASRFCKKALTPSLKSSVVCVRIN